MKIIAHRGNINGPSEKENSPSHIYNAIVSGFDVEVDVRVWNDELWLGHDGPQYKVDWDFFEIYKKFLWCHAKNQEALEALLERGYHVFWHQDDDYTFTSKGVIWAYPGKHTTGIYVLPEKYNLVFEDSFKGICTDYCYHYYRQYSHN